VSLLLLLLLLLPPPPPHSDYYGRGDYGGYGGGYGGYDSRSGSYGGYGGYDSRGGYADSRRCVFFKGGSGALGVRGVQVCRCAGVRGVRWGGGATAATAAVTHAAAVTHRCVGMGREVVWGRGEVCWSSVGRYGMDFMVRIVLMAAATPAGVCLRLT
jgi:hypothetical protein